MISARIFHQGILLCVVASSFALVSCGAPESDGSTGQGGSAAGRGAIPEGDWGSTSAMVRTSSSGTLYYHGCTMARIKGPIPLANDGTFLANGQVVPESTQAQAPRRRHLTDEESDSSESSSSSWSSWSRSWMDWLTRARHRHSSHRWRDGWRDGWDNDDDRSDDGGEWGGDRDYDRDYDRDHAPTPNPQPAAQQEPLPATFTGKQLGDQLTITTNYTDKAGKAQQFTDDVRRGAQGPVLSGCR